MAQNNDVEISTKLNVNAKEFVPRNNHIKISSTSEPYSDPEIQKQARKIENQIGNLSTAYFKNTSEKIIKSSVRPIRILKGSLDEFLDMFDRISAVQLKNAYMLIAKAYFAIATIYQRAEHADLYITTMEKSFDLLNAASPKIDLNINKLSIAIKILVEVLTTNDKDQAKKYLKICNELYHLCRDTEKKINEHEQGDVDANEYSAKTIKTPKSPLSFLKQEQVSILDDQHAVLICAYVIYYSNFDDNSDKSLHYGIMAKKYEPKYNDDYQPAYWIINVVEFAVECRKLGAGKQCHHLLLAAKSVFKRSKKNLGGDEYNPLHMDHDFLESYIDVELANYYLWVLECPAFKRPKGGKLVNCNSFIDFGDFGILNCQEKLDLQLEAMTVGEINDLVEKIKLLITNIEERELQWDMMNFLDLKDTRRKFIQVMLTVAVHSR